MSLPIAECRSRHHRYADETGLRCKLFKTYAELFSIEDALTVRDFRIEKRKSVQV